MNLSVDRLNDEAFLLANSKAYEWLLRNIQSLNWQRTPDGIVQQIASVARFAVEFHPGRFADGALENVLLEIGANLGNFGGNSINFTFQHTPKYGRRRVMHVVSSVLGTGGHTRMIYQWVRQDLSSCHSLVLLSQGNVMIPQWLSESFRKSGGDLIALPHSTGNCQKARWLREIARKCADLVVLHVDPVDVVPSLTFAVDNSPPVVLLNHADHLFFLGSTVADMFINLRTLGREDMASRRFMRSNTVLPIPLQDRVKVPKHDARKALGISEDQVMLLSVGRGIKYRPCGLYDFVATANKILDRYPCAHLYIVGESQIGISPYLRCAVHNRLHFIGSLDSPSSYHAAADIYLESFPFGSQTALMEAALSGLPVVPAYAPLSPLLVANDDGLNEILDNPTDERDYIERVASLIMHPDQRMSLGEILRKRLLTEHVGQGWLDRLDSVYKETDRLTHCPRSIPVSRCSITGTDVGLSLWHVIADGRTNLIPEAHSTGDVLRHSAFVAKQVGNYGEARRIACKALRHSPLQRESWRLLMVTLLGKSGKSIRRWLLQLQTRRQHHRKTEVTDAPA